jgi:hypothetical protein
MDMIGKLLGALVGRELDRRDGDSGIKGAVLGAAAAGLMRRAGPLALLAGGAWLAKKAYDHRKTEKRDRQRVAAEGRPVV